MHKKFLAAAVLTTVFSANAFAADAIFIDNQPAADIDHQIAPDWSLLVTPYLWASGIKGNISPFKRAPSIEVEKSFKDIVKDLNFGGFLDVRGRYEDFIFAGDLMYINTTDIENISKLPVIGPVQGLSAQVDSAQFTATLKGGYRVYNDETWSLDLLGGLRIWHISNDVTIRYNNFSESHNESFSWVDPIIGFRAFINFTPSLSLQLQGDGGGFNVGSKETWQGLATLNYTFTKHLSTSVGYKYLRVNYSDKGHTFDTTLKGPVVGMTYRF
ncbi:hypothetical protein ACI0FM_15040 [Paenochrobactrum sp. BZR 588]|uniref:hypothetical protein n=1 Tax=Paenochrobactrum TaxID=999488 RepID=UPI0035BC72FB